MHTSPSILALFGLVAGSSANPNVKRHLPTTRVRSLGLKAINKARSKAIHRRMNEADDGDMDWGNTDGGGMDLSDIDVAAMMPLIVPMMCGILEADMFKEDIQTQAAAEGVVCSKFGCDYSNNPTVPNLVMDCTMDDELCDDEDQDGEQFCITNSEIQMSLGLDFVNESVMELTQCSNYTKPDYMKAMGRGCLDFGATLNFGALIEAALSDEVDTVIEEEHIKLTQCSAEFSDGTGCSCGTCNEGTGFEFECDNELGSQECTDFDTSVPDVGMMSGGEAEIPAISVIRFSATTQSGNVAKESDAINDDTGAEKDGGTSPAALRTENLAAGVILASAFSLALL